MLRESGVHSVGVWIRGSSENVKSERICNEHKRRSVHVDFKRFAARNIRDNNR